MMIIIETTPAFKAMKAQQKLSESINKISSYILFALNINPYDSGLVALCGKPGDRNNREAVKSWVKHQLCCPSCMRVRYAHELTERLYTHLNKRQHDINYFA